MDLRDYFAAKAMAIYFTGPDVESISGTLENVAEWCYEMADEMLKARSK
jgi:hypothetical protein